METVYIHGMPEPMSLLEEMRQSTPEWRAARRADLLEGCPLPEWPSGMPTAALPVVQFIGVSPGNSPAPGDTEDPKGTVNPSLLHFGDLQAAETAFGYADSKGYWKKISSLGLAIARHFSPGISDEDALCLLAHLNLGTGSAGKASDDAVEPEVIKWVSTVTRKLNARVIVCCGTRKILSGDRQESWHHPEGFEIAWHLPDTEQNFDTNSRSNFKLQYWFRTNLSGERCLVFSLPNHPSRFPFMTPQIWKSLEKQILQVLKQTCAIDDKIAAHDGAVSDVAPVDADPAHTAEDTAAA